MSRLKVLVTVVLGLLLAVALAPGARAETEVRRDPRGDAPASIDITAARYTHGDRRVSAVATIPDLGRRGVAELAISRFTIFEAGYVVEIRKRPGSEPRVRLLFFDHFGLERRDCPGVSGRWGDTRIRLGVPRHCLDGHIRNRLFVQFGVVRGGEVDRAPAARRLARG